MSSIRREARVAGLLYLFGGITAPFGILYVPRTLVVPGDATATADRVRVSETLLRMGVASELLVATLFIFVALALYRLLKRVDEHHALAMLFPFGMLVIRSGFIPRVLGVFLIIAGSAYLVSSIAALCLPQYARAVSQWATPLVIGELPIVIWFLFWGAKEQRAHALFPVIP